MLILLWTFTGVNWIHCLDRSIVLWIFWILYIHITESGFTAFWTLSISWSRQYSCVNSLNISRQTFCVIGYIKDSRTRTFCVVECGTGHRI